MWRVAFFMVVGIAVLAIVTFIYAFPLLSRFDNKTLIILRNAVFMSVKHMGQTVPLIFILAIIVVLAIIGYPVSIFFAVGAWVYISSIFLNKVLDRYMPKDERYEDGYYLGATPEESEAASAGIVNMDIINSQKEQIEEIVESDTYKTENEKDSE